MENAKNTVASATNWDDQEPVLGEEWFAKADVYIGEKLVRRGRPKAEKVKKAVSLRLDEEVIAHFKKGGRGWQTRVNEALRKAASL